MVNIKKLIHRKGLLTVINNLLVSLRDPVIIEDTDGNLLLGNEEGERSAKCPVEVSGDIIGWVSGRGDVSSIARLLSYLAETELEKKDLARETLNKYKEINLLYDITEKIAVCLDLKEVAQLIIAEATGMIRSDSAALMLFSDVTGKLELISFLGRVADHIAVIEPGKGIIGGVFASGRAEIIHDVRSDSRHIKDYHSNTSILCAPLKVKDKTIGVINIGSKETFHYTAADMKLLITLATQVAAFIENARLFAGLKEASEALEIYNRTLEQKVEERTRLLAETNSKLQQANEMLHNISLRDGLTGIGNRRCFDETIEKEWKRAMRHLRPVSLLLMDIDYFKAFNDRYGHLCGDDCLKKVAAAVSENLKRSGDLSARYGGEEFVVLLPDTEGRTAVMIAESIRSAIKELGIIHEGSKVCAHVTISIGIATLIPEQGSIPALLIDSADRALYQAKHEGRNRLKVFE